MTRDEILDKVKISHFIRKGMNLKGVVHVGAHDGYEVEWYLKLGLKVVAVEPNPIAIRNFRPKFPNVWLNECALSDFEAVGSLAIPSGDGQGASLLTAIKENPSYPIVNKIAVDLKRGDSLKLMDCDCLVIDAEGTELRVLKGFGDTLSQFKAIMVECSRVPVFIGQAPASEVISYLATQGFKQDSPIEEHNDIMFIKESRYRKSIETTEELGAWYSAKYTEMGDGWNTPAEECNKHLDDLGVPFDRSKLLLDVGCGAGHFLAEAVKRVESCGIEISTVGVALSEKRAPQATVLLKTIEAKNGEAIYDYIVSLGSLEHIVDLDAALDRIRDLLKPDGKWYFYCPNENWHYEDQPNERTMTDAEWMRLFREHGLYTLKATRWGTAQDNTAFIGTKEQAPPPTVESWFGEHLLLNVGSGQRPFPKPWINIDKQSKWNPDIVSDGATLGMIADGQAKYVILHHVLEHYGCGEAVGLIKECHRMLEPGGSLLVFVPDMRALAKKYLERGIDAQLFFTNVYGAYMGDPADQHMWGFDSDTLMPFLNQAAQWKQIKRFDWRVIPGASIAKDFWILSAECVR